MCACFGVQVNTLLPEAETWVDPSVGGRALGWVPHRERERASEIKGNEVCGFLCVCVSGPVAQHWSRLAPTGMRLLSAPPAAPCSTRRWPPGKRGERGRNPPSPTRASNKGQFISPFTGGPGRRTGHQRAIRACQQHALGLLGFVRRSADGDRGLGVQGRGEEAQGKENEIWG